MPTMQDFKPVSDEELAALKPDEKLYRLHGLHQALPMHFKKQVSEAVTLGIKQAYLDNREPSDLLIIFASKDGPSDPDNPFFPKEVRDTWKVDLAVMPVYRQEFLKEPLEKWGRTHPYWQIIRDIATKPPEGELWMLVLVYGTASAYTIGPQREEMASPTPDSTPTTTA